jgi:hypothetical protein
MATKAFTVEQLIFVDECHKSESVFVPRSLSSSAQVHKCNAGTAHKFFVPRHTDKVRVRCGVGRPQRGTPATRIWLSWATHLPT